MYYRKYSSKQRLDYKQSQKKEIFNTLSYGVKCLINSKKWENYLKYQSKFWKYSFNNCILILTQCPNATKVAGHRSWQNLGRRIIRGQKAIWIQAPQLIKNEEQPENPHVYFKLVPVFDVSQTEGEELPTMCTELKETDSENVDNIFLRLRKIIEKNITIEVKDYDEKSNGYYNIAENKIVIQESLSNQHKLKTLIHEYTHYLLHRKNSDKLDKEIKEVEAESTAFCVMNHFGLDSKDYSFGYIANWAEGDYKKIEACGKNIQKATKTILEQMEVAE